MTYSGIEEFIIIGRCELLMMVRTMGRDLVGEFAVESMEEMEVGDRIRARYRLREGLMTIEWYEKIGNISISWKECGF